MEYQTPQEKEVLQHVGKKQRESDRMAKKTATAINSGQKTTSLKIDTSASSAKVIWGDLSKQISTNGNTPDGDRNIRVLRKNSDVQEVVCFGAGATGAYVFEYGISITRMVVKTSTGSPNMVITIADVDPFTGNVMTEEVSLTSTNSSAEKEAIFPTGKYLSRLAAIIVDVPANQDCTIDLTKECTYADPNSNYVS